MKAASFLATVRVSLVAADLSPSMQAYYHCDTLLHAAEARNGGSSVHASDASRRTLLRIGL